MTRCKCTEEDHLCLKVLLKKSCLFYYDTLPLITVKETHKWMKEKGYKSMCILPEMDIFSRDPILKGCRGCPPGNIPELYNLDSCPNQYFHKVVCCHVRYTHSLHKFYLKRFSIATPKKGTSTYLRIFDPIDGVTPPSKRTISDMYDVLTSIQYIVEAKFCTIPDVNNVKTCRRGVEGKFGGARTEIMGK